MGSDPNRRAVLAGLAASVGVTGAAVGGYYGYRHYRQPPARVTALRHPAYDDGLSAHLEEGIRRYPAVVAKAKGGRVVLKPNFVEFHEGRPINTNVQFVAATVEAFRRIGAAEVLVAEGPGHLRDTEYLLELTGLGALLRDVGARFVDLNIDDGHSLALPTNFTGMNKIAFAKTAVTCDLLVSLAKMKTHHWTGATLTMKNLFGIVPSGIYGWPKNPLHWAGIERSIVDIWEATKPGFGIIDGIVGMEGDGPIMGTPKDVGLIMMGDNLTALDAHTCRLMGINPEFMPYLAETVGLGGTIDSSRITADGDVVTPVEFELIESKKHLRA